MQKDREVVAKLFVVWGGRLKQPFLNVPRQIRPKRKGRPADKQPKPVLELAHSCVLTILE